MTYTRPTEVFAPMLLKRYFEAYSSGVLEKYEITSSYSPFIMELFSDKGTTHKELTERVGIHKSLTTRVLKTLIEKEIVENRGAGKEYSIFLTEKGATIKSELLETLHSAICYMFSDLTPNEKDALKTISEKVKYRIDEFNQSQDKQ